MAGGPSFHIHSAGLHRRSYGRRNRGRSDCRSEAKKSASVAVQNNADQNKNNQMLKLKDNPIRAGFLVVSS
jgi:hypothetical protein